MLMLMCGVLTSRCPQMQVQLLVKPEVIRHYNTFDELINQLGRLAARRRLFDHERYAAARLMGQLTMYCYEEGVESSAMSRTSRRTGLATSRTSGKRSAQTDHTAGLYLLLVGKGRITLGSETVEVTHMDVEKGTAPRRIRKHDRLQIEGQMCSVLQADATGTRLTLDKPISLALPAGMEGEPPMPPALIDGDGTGEVWLMLENHSPEMNLDCQLLLLNMGAHKAALRLLQLPFDMCEIRGDELELRAVLRASYRLLKAMTAGCSRAQHELVHSLSLFVKHTQANLVSHDVSPTGCINAVFKDNRTVCTQVEHARSNTIASYPVPFHPFLFGPIRPVPFRSAPFRSVPFRSAPLRSDPIPRSDPI